MLWIALSIGLAFGASRGVFDPMDRWLYDRTLPNLWQPHGAKLDTDTVVLIAIDEPSLETYGRWPWSRSVHAQLLDRLKLAGKPPKVVAFDLLFPEPENPAAFAVTVDADQALANAIQSFPSPVIAATLSHTDQARWRWIKPRAPLLNSGLRLAHIHTQTDIDGYARRFQPVASLAEAGSLAYMGIAMREPALAPRADQLFGHTVRAGLPDEALMYAPPEQWVKTVSYKDVLGGAVDESVWAGKRVLVAARAEGLGDQFVSPLFPRSPVIKGSDIILASLYTELAVASGAPRLSEIGAVGMSISIIFLCGLCLVGLSQLSRVSRQLIWVGGLCIGWALVTLAMLQTTGLWLRPGATLLTVLMAWLCWLLIKFKLGFHFIAQLQRADSAPSHLRADTEKLAQSKHGGVSNQALGLWAQFKSSSARNTPMLSDRLDAQIETARRYQSQRASELAMLNQIIQFLPESALVLSEHPAPSETLFRLELLNQKAEELIQLGHLPFAPTEHTIEAHAAAPSGLKLSQWLRSFTPVLTQIQRDSLQGVEFAWDSYAPLSAHLGDNPHFEAGIECINPKRQPYLVQIKRIGLIDPSASRASQQDEITILTLTDLSVSNTLRQQRESSLNFLSHDLRSPQSTILALLELEAQRYPDAAPLFQKIELEAQRTIYLAEGFVNLTRAEQGERYQFELHNLSDIMLESVDELYAQAQRKQVQIVLEVPEDEVLVQIDRTHIGRAITNLLRNAIHHSPSSETTNIKIFARVWQANGVAYACVDDQGAGIAPAFKSRLFQPFQQSNPESRQGFGLGLAYVKTVVNQHQGTIEAISPINDTPTPHGTRFQITLTLASDMDNL